MRELQNLVLSGLVTGAIYSIMASGLVLTYTTSGIFNFAHGAIAFASAYLYYQLNTGVGLPIVPSLLVAVFLFAPLLGLALDRVLLRRLATAPVYARIVGTIGLSVMLPALAQWLVVTVAVGVVGWDLPGDEATTAGVPVPGIGPTPARSYQPLDGVVLTSDQLAVFVVAALGALVLWYAIRRTRLGLEMRAVVDRDDLAGLRGVDAQRSSAAAWVMTTVLAGLGGVLIAPLFTLNDYVYTLVVLGSLAVVVLGGLRSIPVAFAGGLGLGVVQNLVAGYSDDVLPDWLSTLSGLKAAVPFVLVVVLLLVFGQDRSRRGGTVADEVPRPDHRAGLSPLRRRACWAACTLALVAYTQQWFTVSWMRADAYGQTVLAQGLAVSIIFLSFVVVTGMGGMVSLAQATFVTVGGFAAGWALGHDWGIDVPGVASDGQLNFFLALVFGAVAAGLVGALMALPVTRLGGVSLALGTLAFAFIGALVVFPLDSVGNDQAGWVVRAPTLDVPGVNQVVDLLVLGDQPVVDTSLLPVQILLFLCVFGIVTLGIHAFGRSASGRAILAVRSSQVAAEACGIRAHRAKVVVFALSAAIAGLGGVMLGLFSFGVNETTAPPIVGLYWLALAVTFGIRRPGGALLAGLAFTGGTMVLEWLGDALPGTVATELVTSVYFVPILSGLGAIQLAQEPDGLLSLAGQRRLARQRARRAAKLAVLDPAHTPAPESGPAPDAVPTAGAVPPTDADAVPTAGSVPAPDAVPTAGAAPTAEAVPTTRSVPPTDAVPTAGSVPNATAGVTPVLDLRGIVAGYGDAEVLHGVDLQLGRGSITALLGANGAGKSTLCAVAAGTLTPARGTVRVDGGEVTALPPYRRARAGVLLVPEARGVFPGLTVEENLAVSLRSPTERDAAYARFPVLGERRSQAAGLLSGGEQQMLGLAPALVAPPAVLIADEPTLGLAPLLAGMVMDAVREISRLGTAVLLVEEHAQNALGVADAVAFMELGRIVWAGPRSEADLELLSSAYLGHGAGDEGMVVA